MSFCYDDYSVFNHEDQNFTLNWNQIINGTLETDSTMTQIYKSFKYKGTLESSSYPYFGVYTNYLGGGYFFDFLNLNVSNLQSNLTALQESGWTDRLTRAIFLEMTTFNPNINLFTYCTVLFEVLPTGNIIKSIRIDSLNLTDVMLDAVSVKVIANIIYLVFVVFFMVKELSKLRKAKKEYFKSFWNYVELSVIACSWASFAMYLYRMYAVSEILEKLKKYSDKNMIRLQSLSIWNESLTICLALCTGLATFRFLKLLKLNRRVNILTLTLKHSFKDLISFGLIFFIIYLSFVQFAYLIFNESTISLSTIVKALETCFQMMLGKFETETLTKAHFIFGPVLYITYNLGVVMILLNLFISIINDSYAYVKNDKDLIPPDAEIFDHFRIRFRKYLGWDSDETKVNGFDAHKYITSVNYFPRSVDNFIEAFNKVKAEKERTEVYDVSTISEPNDFDHMNMMRECSGLSAPTENQSANIDFAQSVFNSDNKSFVRGNTAAERELNKAFDENDTFAYEPSFVRGEIQREEHK
jgi:polycystin 1L2